MSDHRPQPRADALSRRVRPDPGLRRRSNGTVLIGGSPMRILRLSAGGARVVDRWCRGESVGPAEAHHELADRLVAGGMFHPVPTTTSRVTSASPSGTIVVPVKDDRAGLYITLDSLTTGGAGERWPVVVVDDGSQRPVVVDETDWPGVQVVRHTENRGPAAARTTGLDHVRTELVAFVDAGVVVSSATLRRLAERVGDEGLVAAAPRIEAFSGAEATALSRYEERRSPLDLGPIECLVGVGRQVPYLPTACLVARVDAVATVGGFDSSLRFGEDVDLVWRLAERFPNRLRYLADLTARHPPRGSIRAMARQRLGYGSAAGPLFSRHREAVAPVRTSWWSLAVAGLLATGHPLLATVTWTATARALVDKLPEMPDRGMEAAMLASRGHVWTIRSLARNSVRVWWPLTLAALVAKPTRGRAAFVAAAGLGERLLERPSDPVLDVALGLVDDLAYGAGVWLGSWRERTVGALLPDLITWPPPD